MLVTAPFTYRVALVAIRLLQLCAKTALATFGRTCATLFQQLEAKPTVAIRMGAKLLAVLRWLMEYASTRIIGTVAILTALLTRSLLHFTIELANRLRAEIPATIENEEKHCRRNCFLISGAIFTQRLFCFCGGNSPRRRIL